MRKPSDYLFPSIISLVIAISSYFVITNTMPDKTDTAKIAVIVAAIGAATWIFIVLISMLFKYGLPALNRQIAKAAFGCLVAGFKLWFEERNNGDAEQDNLAMWFADQLMVLQHRYAFSISCIVLRERQDGELECLLTRRTNFPGFDGITVLIWPGGRFRGLQCDIEDELRQRVLDESGYTITLLRTISHDNLIQSIGNSEDIDTWNPEQQTLAKNQLYIPPLFLMRQNRPQVHGVPGHIDLIYLSEVTNSQRDSHNDRIEWISVSRLDEYDQWSKEQLWPDTRECIKRAVDVYKSIRSQRAVGRA